MTQRPLLFVRALLIGAVCTSVLEAPTFPRTATETVLYGFALRSDAVQPVATLLAGADGALYGTTTAGGASFEGAVFKLTPAGSTYNEAVVWSFRGTDGANPSDALIADDQGTLYGTTQFGGSASCNNASFASGCGTAFELVPHGGGYERRTLHEFCRGGYPCADGGQPRASLTAGRNGELFGAAGVTTCKLDRKSQERCIGGKVFVLEPNKHGYTEQVIMDARSPNGTLVADRSGALYGIAQGGTYGHGIVFKITERRGKFEHHVIWNFGGGSDGHWPSGKLLIASDGTIYGTTSSGGLNGLGTVFKLAPRANSYTETVLYNFCALTNCVDGANPASGVIMDKSGTLYGTTPFGGPASINSGTVFKLTPESDSYAYSLAYNFCSLANCADGQEPWGGLIQDSNGALYGTTEYGGPASVGVVFKLMP